MRPLVSLQAVGTEEALVALRTGIRPRPGVVAQVDGQVAGLSELLAAVGAVEGLVVFVEALVLQELGVGEEPLPAVGAEVRSLPRVRQLVSGQRGLVDETLVACGAAEDLLPGVAALVLLHAALPLEALPTVGTRERLLLRVDLHVTQQTPPVQEAFAALRAHVRPLLLMRPLVCGEGGLVGEALPTAAAVNPLFLVSLQVLLTASGAAEAQVTVGASVGAPVPGCTLAVGLQVAH